MYVYRIERKKYLVDVLSGKGAALCSGNRWNSLHTPMVYTSHKISIDKRQLANLNSNDALHI